MSNSGNSDRFDVQLLNMAQQHPGGIMDVLDTWFGFLRRKTDFFAEPAKAKEAVLKAMKDQQTIYDKDKSDKEAAEKRERENKKAKAAAAAAAKGKDTKASAKIVEVTDEEAKQIEEEQKKKRAAAAAAATTAAAPAAAPATAKAAAASPAPKPATPKAAPAAKAAATAESPAAASSAASSSSSSSSSSATKAEDDEEDNGKLKPGPGNGSTTDKYTWTQVLGEVDVRIPLPRSFRTKELCVEIGPSRLKIGPKDGEMIVDADLHAKIKTDATMWTLEDNGRLLCINMHKWNDMEWWSRLVVGEAEINTQKVQPENSKLDDLDGETRTMVEKMMFDNRQKALGLPTSDEMPKHDALRSFMSQHPEMDFSKAKIS